jgi:hypothetical protein
MTDETATPVNDSQTLTHEMVMRAIRTTEAHESARLLRQYADECDRVGATSLAVELRQYAETREAESVDFSAIDRTADALLATLADLYPGRSGAGACLAALEIVFGAVPRDVLAERIAAAQLARSLSA